MYMAAYGYLYIYRQHLVSWEVHKTSLQWIYTQEAATWLHQANTAMVQRHPTSMQRAVAPAQLPRHMDK